MKKIAELTFKILKPYIRVVSYKSPITLTPHFEVWIFNKKVANIEYSETELLWKV